MGRSFETYQAEKTAAIIRAYLKLAPPDSLDPYALANHLPIRVVTPADIPGVSPGDLRQALGAGKTDWSAGTLDLPNVHLIVLNPTHDRLRKKSTLMEEICHIILGHKPSTLAARNDSVWLRSYDPEIEREAYGVGAAALVPYEGIRSLMVAGVSLAAVARQYDVSFSIVEFRLKKDGLWKMFNRLSAAE